MPVPQVRVCFKMPVYKATHGNAPSYLSQLVRVADLPGQRFLRSARTNRLLVPSVKLYRRRPGLLSCRANHTEQSAGQYDLCSVSFDLPSASEKNFCSLPRSLSRALLAATLMTAYFSHSPYNACAILFIVDRPTTASIVSILRQQQA